MTSSHRPSRQWTPLFQDMNQNFDVSFSIWQPAPSIDGCSVVRWVRAFIQWPDAADYPPCWKWTALQMTANALAIVRRSKEVQYWRDTRVQYNPIFQFTSIDILVSFQVPISIANDVTSAYVLCVVIVCYCRRCVGVWDVLHICGLYVTADQA